MTSHPQNGLKSAGLLLTAFRERLFPSWKAKQLKSILDFSDWSMVVRALKINMKPKNEGLEDDCPFQNRRFSGSSRQFSSL